MVGGQQRGARPLRLSINLGGPRITRGSIVASVAAALGGTGLAPQLRRLRVRIVIAGCGTGRSSLATLKRLPADTLKIDRASVRDTPDDRNDIAIARAIPAPGGEPGLHTAARGAETDARPDLPRDEGRDFFQGLLFTRPPPSCGSAVRAKMSPRHSLPFD